MVVKKLNKKNVNSNIKNLEKKKIIEEKPEIESDDCESFDDMSDEEIKKMLGNSDNSDIDSEDFSEEEFVESNEAKVGKKRKLDTDDEEDIKDAKKSKVCVSGEEDDCEDDCCEDDEDEDDEDEDDEDEDMEDDSFINDDIEEDESSVAVDDKKPAKKVENNKEKPIKTESKKVDKTEEKNKEEKIKIERTQENEEFRKIYEDTPRVESESLRKELKDRIVERKNKTLVLLGLPFKFNQAQAKILIPDMVSIILPYNVHRHQINGNAYVDVSKPESVASHISKLKGFKIKGQKMSCFPLNKVDDNIDNYNCTRLVISNLSSKTTPEILKRTMVKATTIKMLPVKKTDKRMTLTAFAEYPSVEDAIFDYDNKHGVEIDGMLINVKFQSKSNTNIKKGISWDKTALQVVGINKAMSNDDMKKLFPQALKINWKVGDQVAHINYENEGDCSVDYSNSFKNKPHGNMKIFYKCLMHKSGGNEPRNNLGKIAGNNNKKEFRGKKEFAKKEENKENSKKESIAIMKKGNKEGKNEKKNFKPKQKFNGKKATGAKKEFPGVKKTNFKPSQNNKMKSKNGSEKDNTSNTKLHTVGNIKIEEKITGSLKKNIENFKKPFISGEKNSMKTEKKIIKENVVNSSTKNKDVNIETFKLDKGQIKKEKKIKSELINKKKQDKRAKKLLKRRLRKEKLAKEQNKL